MDLLKPPGKGRGGAEKATGPAVPDKLRSWQERLADSDRASYAEIVKMDERERLYSGDNTLSPLTPGDVGRNGALKRTSHVRNIIFENIESQVSSSIPQPKVTPQRERHEKQAEVIENFLRNELDRLPFEVMNDLAERTVPVQGGGAWLVEWDNDRRTHTTVGEVTVSFIHPKRIAPQPGVFTGVGDMDWIIIKVPTTKEAVRRRYGVSVELEGEAEPDVRSVGGAEAADDAVTQYIGFSRNDNGGIDRYSWVNDVELEDLGDYQARGGGGQERVWSPITTAGGLTVPGASPVFDEFGSMEYDGSGMPIREPTALPYYVPGVFPVVLQRSVSVYGQLLGNSDVDVIRDQQNTVNRLSQKIIDRMVKAGTRVTLPEERADLRVDAEDNEVWRVNEREKQLIGVLEFNGDVSNEMVYLASVYEEARQVIGITDSYQGRKDATATSGKAKEFAAAQSAGRLESKRVMKDAAYAELFELMFKFWLAYADEPRPLVHKNSQGKNEYLEFNRYDFLEQDEDGEFYWNDCFLFSTDTSAPLASNREALWQETRMNLQTGAFGDPRKTETLILFWNRMEDLHYPHAGLNKQYFEETLEREQMAQQQGGGAPGMGGMGAPGVEPMEGMQGIQGIPGMMPGGGMGGGLPPGGPGAAMGGELPQGYQEPMLDIPPQVLAAVERQARGDAMRAARGRE